MNAAFANLRQRILILEALNKEYLEEITVLKRANTFLGECLRNSEETNRPTHLNYVLKEKEKDHETANTEAFKAV